MSPPKLIDSLEICNSTKCSPWISVPHAQNKLDLQNKKNKMQNGSLVEISQVFLNVIMLLRKKQVCEIQNFCSFSYFFLMHL